MFGTPPDIRVGMPKFQVFPAFRVRNFLPSANDQRSDVGEVRSQAKCDCEHLVCDYLNTRVAVYTHWCGTFRINDGAGMNEGTSKATNTFPTTGMIEPNIGSICTPRFLGVKHHRSRQVLDLFSSLPFDTDCTCVLQAFPADIVGS